MKINIIVESLKTTNYLIAAAAVAGTVMMPIPPVRAADAGMQTAAVSLPQSKPLRMKTSAHAPLDLAAVARMAPPEVVAQAERLAAHDTIGILTKQQIADYTRSNPGFVAKLQHAYLTGTEPQLTHEESRILQAISDAALLDMKAGDSTVTAPVVPSSPLSVNNTNNNYYNSTTYVAGALGLLLALIIFAILSENYCRGMTLYGLPTSSSLQYTVYRERQGTWICQLRRVFGLD
jgi:hypothetical protein